jgi:hypothetical protein
MMIVVVVAAATTTAAAALATENDVVVLSCATGLEGGSTMHGIPKSWINDGYCDCPLDGMDEPDTDACSGSQSWPGVSRVTDLSSKDGGR